MSPTPHKVEVDLERKEELILAKQLRECRVRILPRNNDNCYQLRSSVSPQPRSASPREQGGMSKERSPQTQRLDVMTELQSKMPQRVIEQKKSPSLQPMSPSPTVQKSPSPKILINDTEEPASAPVFTVKKLPFLNDIKRLRQSEPHSPVTTLSPSPGVVGDMAETSAINPHLGYVENRPKMTEFPFLDDIRKLRRENNVEQTNSIETESELSRVSEERLESGREQFQHDLLKYNKRQESTKLTSSQSPSPPYKTVRFSTLSPSPDRDLPATAISSSETALKEDNDSINDVRVHEQDYQEEARAAAPRTPTQKPKRSSKYNLKIDEKTNVKKLADQMIPQLNVMQKNFLGLLFFNELSQNIVDDIVAQQLSMMPGSKLASVLSGLDPQASYTSLNLMLNSINDETRLAMLCENFAYMSNEEKAGVIFTTSDDVTGVCTTIADFGGRSFKKALISKMLENEDTRFLDDVIVDHQRNVHLKTPRRKEEDQRHFSSAEDTYNSAEESLTDAIDDEAYQYEYFDVDSK